MNDKKNIDKVIAAILTVPEKKLLLIQIVNSIPIKNGEIAYLEIQKRTLEINLAITSSAARCVVSRIAAAGAGTPARRRGCTAPRSNR